MLTQSQRETLYEKMRTVAQRMADIVNPLTAEQVTTPYIIGEWSIAQNVHHLADAQMNAYIRFKLLLLEDNPTIKTWEQNVWATTLDGSDADVADSLEIIVGVHQRWVKLMQAIIDENVWQRSGQHPENGTITLDDLLRYYGEHGEAHIVQIQQVMEAMPA
jgi:uncharacterized damage-inducible protein DinB